MIDIENAIFNRIALALREAFPGIYVAGEPVDTPPQFPAVCLWEQANSVYEKSQTAECRENHADVMFQCDIYGNSDTKKLDVKKIARYIDTLMEELGFIRTYGQPTPNLADATIYRYTTRYKAVVSKEYMIFTS